MDKVLDAVGAVAAEHGGSFQFNPAMEGMLAAMATLAAQTGSVPTLSEQTRFADACRTTLLGLLDQAVQLKAQGYDPGWQAVPKGPWNRQ